MWFLPPLLLIIVAIHHRWRMRSRNQSAWKGGGFAMFSEIFGNTDTTTLSAKAKEGGDLSLTVLGVNHPLREKARSIPTEKNWLSWVRWVAAREWTRCGSSVHLPMPGQEGASLTVERVTVRFRQIDFDGRSGEYSARDVADYSIDSAAPSKRGHP